MIFVNHSDGNLAVSNSDSNLGVSPALNLDLSAVLFSTVKFEDKSTFSETRVLTNLPHDWVLTLSSGDTGFKAVRTNPEEIITAGAGGNVKLSLSGAMSGANQISAMLLDSNNTVLRYGKISEAADSEASVAIPAGLAEGGVYRLRVFSEEAYNDRTSLAGNIESIFYGSFTVNWGVDYTPH